MYYPTAKLKLFDIKKATSILKGNFNNEFLLDLIFSNIRGDSLEVFGAKDTSISMFDQNKKYKFMNEVEESGLFGSSYEKAEKCSDCFINCINFNTRPTNVYSNFIEYFSTSSVVGVKGKHTIILGNDIYSDKKYYPLELLIVKASNSLVLREKHIIGFDIASSFKALRKYRLKTNYLVLLVYGAKFGNLGGFNE